jgi:predicted membrane-bound spermidine synthase
VAVPASRAAPLLFVSGACALVYQVAWLRSLRDVFGASTAASAAVLAAFMGGLGAGGLVLGRRIGRSKTPLLFYAHLELLIGLSACATPFLVGGAHAVYLAMGGQGALGSAGAAVVRLLLTAIVLGVPTLLMGGTLPAAARAATPADDRSRRAVAILYGTNTIGAVCGALAANFFLLEIFGTRLTLFMAALVNVLLGVVARVVARLPGADDGPAKKTARAEPIRVPVWFPPVAACLSGFVFLLMELVWYRMLGPLLGGSSYTFGLILAIALAGIGVGGVLYALRKPQPTLVLFGITCALEALCIALPFALGDRVAVLAILLRPLGMVGFGGHLAAWTALCGIVVFPAAVVSGYQFPLTIALFAQSDRADVSRHIAIAYAANTLGSIAGSLAGGFGLLPALTAPGCWRLASYVLVVLAIASSALGFVRLGESRGRVVATWLVSLAAFFLLRAQGPTALWRHSPIGAGRVDPARLASRNGIADFTSRRRRTLRWESDGVESTVGLADQDSLDFLVSGKSDGNALGDAGTQVMGGLLGYMIRPHTRSAYVIGLGTGSTAGWLGAIPELERVDVLEIEPSILHVADACAAVNQRVLANPKVKVRIGDAREDLVTSKQTYDLVFSEPSNPYRAGVSSFFTLDFYQSVKARLAPEGVFLQWLQLYEVDAHVVHSVLTTMSAVFPHVSIWETLPGDVLLVATNTPQIVDVEQIRTMIRQEPFRTALRGTWQTDDVETFLAHHLANEDLALDVKSLGLEPNTDDRNGLEYAFARTVGKEAFNVTAEAWKVSRATKRDRPRTVGSVDWDAVDARRIAFAPIRDLPKGLLKLADALSEYGRGALGPTFGAWRAWGKPPQSLVERRLVAEALSHAGTEEEAKVAIDLWAEEAPGEAHLLRARLLARTKHAPEAAAELSEGLRAFRTDPWMSRALVQRALTVAGDLAKDPALLPIVLEGLAEPFAVEALEETRRVARVEIVDVENPLCVEVHRVFEPQVIWEEAFLERRRDCYQKHGAPLAGAAEDDLRRFLKDAPSKL